MWTSLLALADDDEDDDPGSYDEFRSNYDLDDDSVFDNDDIDNGEGYVCIAVTDSLNPPQVDEYKDDDILLRHGVFDVNGNPSIHPNFFNGVLNDSLGCPYINNNPFTPTQVLHYALLKSPSLNRINTKMMISYCTTVCLMSMAIQVSIPISSMAFSMIALVVHTSTTTPLPLLKYFTTPCSNLR